MRGGRVTISERPMLDGGLETCRNRAGCGSEVESRSGKVDRRTVNDATSAMRRVSV